MNRQFVYFQLWYQNYMFYRSIFPLKWTKASYFMQSTIKFTIFPPITCSKFLCYNKLWIFENFKYLFFYCSCKSWYHFARRNRNNSYKRMHNFRIKSEMLEGYIVILFLFIWYNHDYRVLYCVHVKHKHVNGFIITSFCFLF
jgi:hypothetical protein